MTEQKQPQLVPGPDLDAAVARALGFSVEPTSGLWGHDLGFKCRVGLGDWRIVPRYSTDMSACWREVVPELESQRRDISLKSMARYDMDGMWHVGVTDENGEGLSDVVSTELVPAALCRALLKVKEKGES